MSALADILRQRIAVEGPLPFREFMSGALYHPEHGYYSSGRAAIGRTGDFFTNISVGPLFGALLARQFTEMWERLDEPEVFDIVEQGAHRGDFARDVLSFLKLHAPPLHARVRYHIIEPSSKAEAVQRETLAVHAPGVGWSRGINDLAPFTGVHFSNELLDAFPVHSVIWNGEEWRERHVDSRSEQFVFVDAPLTSEPLRVHLAQLPQNLGAGYTTEVNLAAFDWIESVAEKLERGFVLAIDYGFSRADFYHLARREGTLTGYARHRRIDDVLAQPGEIDLTAHVEFTSLIERGEAAGLRLHGFCDQHHFMVGLGSQHFTDNPALTPEQMRELRAFKTLMHPSLMGTSFKALCLEKSAIALPRLSAFQFAAAATSAMREG